MKPDDDRVALIVAVVLATILIIAALMRVLEP